ncbi:universal stress protein [Flavobacterium psychrophilum]|uniref:universal stress protein n=1 Tax=Flavobacterium psychrophilum TaxID=96345 RepID=UPI00090A574D|nr:universal stress protein [Flavobacterium psychrophilum]EKT2072594.1 universal stress protein [Flavobacterium psychrophilum]EKT4492107.1 universal stress protein [Flavobacterium psychrophilum]SHH93496.1 Probable universal stress protein, UspA family [Flavobacterium psychrophilum]
MKIVVTTDFSSNSKKGILFAMQLATQTNCELIFYNVVTVFRPSIWDDVYYGQFETNELNRNQNYLENFISNLYLESKIAKTKYNCVCEVGMFAGNQIIEYAKTINARYICVSTVGEGKLSQLFGTTASQLITFSPTPVIIVPKNYRIKPIATLFFASDFKNVAEEFQKIEEFSKSINAKLDVYHYDYKWFLDANKNKFARISNIHQSENITFHSRKLDSGEPLLDHLEKDINKAKPSIVVLFTKQNRNWFSRLFLSSLSAELAFDTKTPMLVFRKHTK